MTPRIYEVWSVRLVRTPHGQIREEACIGYEECRWRAAAFAREQDTLALVRALFGAKTLYSNGKEAVSV